MRKLLFTCALAAIIVVGCNTKKSTPLMENPFFSEYQTPFKVPDFNKIKDEHYEPAFKRAIEEKQKEINAITSNTDTPSFSNTIEAIENSGKLLHKIEYVFDNLLSANTNDTLKAIAQRIAPKTAKLNDDIYLNEILFEKVKSIYNQKEQLQLNKEQTKLLEETFKHFVRGGANLEPDAKTQLREINQQLSVLSLKFSDNVLNETNAFEMLIDNKDNLAGLPQSVIDAASESAKKKGHENKWLFTIHKPSLIPFLQYADNRALREKIFKGYINKGDNNNSSDNKEIVKKMISLRIKKANLLGFKSHSEFVLTENMAKTPETVNAKLNSLMEKALVVAKAESEELQNIIDKEGGNFKLEPWDWWYYSEKVKNEKFNLDENELRPYFELNNTVDGLLSVANNLFGLKFDKRDDIPVPHPDAIAYEVKESDDQHIGILYMDFHPRESKRGGAWMSAYRGQSKCTGKDITPVITMVCNFTKPTANTPALLSFEEVTTLYHEFGHALHGLLSNCYYKSLSGTSVARDFVELPSQIMENWAAEPEVMKSFAKHYQTGEVIPDELLKKLELSSKFNQGFVTVEYLAAAILDMDYHTLTSDNDFDVNEFEKNSIKKMKLIPEIVLRYRTTYFLHIFSHDYSAGYYSYIWAGILDADAFEAFKENGLFDKATATAFRKEILEKGGTGDPMEMYMKFRGKEPNEAALLKRRGLL